MAAISLLIKPVGGMCNMRCRYCFYRDEQEKGGCNGNTRMQLSTLDAVFQKTLPYATGRCVIAYQGGEPTLAGLDFFAEAVKLEKKYASSGCIVEHAIQTNGLNINREWADFFAKEHILVGISLDGDKKLHDANRIDCFGKGTHQRVMRAISLLQASGADFNVLSVVTNQTCRAAEHTYRFFSKNNIHWQQYITCLSPLDSDPSSAECCPSPKQYAAFLKSQFDLWYQDIMSGGFCYNRYFDNLIGILLGNQPEACDMRGFCSPQLVIDANGDVYPCDFYCLNDFKLGSFIYADLPQIEQQRESIHFLSDSTKPRSECLTCQWRILCRGGCRRYRTTSSRLGTELNINYYCKSYKDFFAYAYPRLCKIAFMVKQSKNKNVPF